MEFLAVASVAALIVAWLFAPAKAPAIATEDAKAA